jgi:hypothetical protein
MNFYQTELQKQISLLPTQLDFLRIAKQRGLPLTNKEENLLYTLEAGEYGEQTVINFLEKFGRDHWLVMRNLWLDYSNPYESDILLFTEHKPYVLEVKNYYGQFIYDNGVCTLEGKKLTNNPIFQTQSAHTNLQRITHEVNPSIQAEGALLLIGEHNEVELNSEIPDIKVKQRHQFRRYIRSIITEEMNHLGYSLDKNKLLAQLEGYEIPPRFQPISLSPKDLEHAHKGIYCLHCKGYNIQVHKSYIQCNNCHFFEAREEAVFRTICEFGVLTFGHDYMKRSDISHFMNHQVSSKYLSNFLKEHFESIGQYKMTRYLSKKLPSDKLQKPF